MVVIHLMAHHYLLVGFVWPTDKEEGFTQVSRFRMETRGRISIQVDMDRGALCEFVDQAYTLTRRYTHK